MNRKKWPQISGLYAFNDKLYIKSFFYKYSLIYIVRYSLLTLKKCVWRYIYALIVKQHC